MHNLCTRFLNGSKLNMHFILRKWIVNLKIFYLSIEIDFIIFQPNLAKIAWLIASNAQIQRTFFFI